MLVFENPGLIDLTAATTLGVNVKDGPTPIGQFGTGLKAAAAIVLRLGGRMEIWRGRKVLTYGVRERTIRGKKFKIVTLNGKDLGFTTEYGGHWEPWMAYRELWSNARDEGGRVRRMTDADERQMLISPKSTLIVVSCPELEAAHEERHKIILQTEALVVVPGLEIHAGGSEHVYYRGIRVATIPGKKRSLFTYNLTSPQTLTEDRTLAYQWMLGSTIAKALVQCTNLSVLHTVLADDENKGHWESLLPYSEIKDQKPSPQFMEVAEQLHALRRLGVGVSKLFNDYRDTMPGYMSPYIVQPTEAEENIVRRAIVLAESATGVPIPRQNLRFKTQLAGTQKVNATVRDGIVVAHSVLSAGDVALACVLVEGLAQIAGGTVVEQLCRMIVTNGFSEDPETRRRRPVGDMSSADIPF